MSFVLAGDLLRMSPVLQSIPPRSTAMLLTGNRLTVQNHANRPISFMLAFVKTQIMQEVGRVAAAARAARELGEKLK